MTLVGEDTQAQTRQALCNLGIVLQAANSAFEKVVKTTIFLHIVSIDLRRYGLSMYGYTCQVIELLMTSAVANDKVGEVLKR
ncbi:hypothetical protein NQ317_006180 [Molorchus minor]|uniref:Uncharacterized protein n=1 Tax=Molorchus minor TaxID=1323400 RepID=A0ABQ9J9L5_9CUCU|nr:hypothetical protein NQ317_006180 [Molorchus minor]